MNKILSLLLICLVERTLGNGPAPSQQTAFRQAQLTCMVPVDSSSKECTGRCRPGKRGPVGPVGPVGPKGDAAPVNDQLEEKVRLLERQISVLEANRLPRNCQDVQRTTNMSGVFTVYPFNPNFGKGLEVFCDMDHGQGGWMVIQRRIDATVNFTRGWEDYKNGFGDKSGNFWMGLENLREIMTDRFELRVDLTSFEDVNRYAIYRIFEIGPESRGFVLTVGQYSGNAGNALIHHNGSMFTTFDRDNDGSSLHNCGEVHKGGWWFGSSYCFSGFLNGLYRTTQIDDWRGIIWNAFLNGKSLKKVQMAIRKL